MKSFFRVALLALLLAFSGVSQAAPKGDREFTVGQLIERLASPKKAARQQAERALRALDRTVWHALREASTTASSERVRKRASALHAALTEAAILELLPTRKPGTKPRRWEQIWSGASLPYLRAFKAQDKTAEVLVIDLWSRLRLSSVGASVLSKLLVQRKVKCGEVSPARNVARDYLAVSFAYRPLSGLVVMARREKERVVVTAQLHEGAQGRHPGKHLEVVIAIGKGCQIDERSRRRLR